MLKIKLQPHGKRGGIKYRIVVMEENSKITGSVVEVLGTYLPAEKSLNLDRDKLQLWQTKGAQVTSGLRKLITN